MKLDEELNACAVKECSITQHTADNLTTNDKEPLQKTNFDQRKTSQYHE